MNKTCRTGVLFLAALIPLGCGEKFSREKTESEAIVTEGSVSGVSSTVAAPGEGPPPLAGTAPLTGTNADTTTAFTMIHSNVNTTGPLDPGNLAGTLPPLDSRPVTSAPRRPSPPPATAPVISIERSQPAVTPSEEPDPTPTPAPAAATPVESTSDDPEPADEPSEEASEPAEPAAEDPPESTTSTQ